MSLKKIFFYIQHDIISSPWGRLPKHPVHLLLLQPLSLFAHPCPIFFFSLVCCNVEGSRLPSRAETSNWKRRRITLPAEDAACTPWLTPNLAHLWPTGLRSFQKVTSCPWPLLQTVWRAAGGIDFSSSLRKKWKQYAIPEAGCVPTLLWCIHLTLADCLKKRVFSAVWLLMSPAYLVLPGCSQLGFSSKTGAVL